MTLIPLRAYGAACCPTILPPHASAHTLLQSWSVAGNAFYYAETGQLPVALNEGAANQAGAAWWPQKLYMDQFYVNFTFKADISSGTNVGDGMTWTVANDPRNTPSSFAAVGGTGGSLGFLGIANAVAFR